MRNSKKMTTRLVLVALLLMITLGYAFLTANLNINGTSKIKDARWNIHFANLALTDGSVTLGEGDSAAVITENNTTEVTYAVTLTKPGDFYEFTVDAVNEGTIDGMVNLVTSTMKEGTGEAVNITDSNLPPYLSYSATYSDGKKIEKNHSLKSGKSEKYKVRIEFKKDITATQLPGAEKSFTFNFQVDYVQADNNAVDVQHMFTGTKYGVYPSANQLYLNQAVPANAILHLTVNEALADWTNASVMNKSSQPFYLKHKIENDVVKESYVVFVVTDEMAAANPGMKVGTYELRGGIDEEEATDKTIYETNKDVIKEAFDYENHSNRCTDNSSDFNCNVSGLYADAYTHGYVRASDYGSTHCYVISDGDSNCD